MCLLTDMLDVHSFFDTLLLNALNYLVLSVYCFPSYFQLIPLMSPKDKKCN